MKKEKKEKKHSDVFRMGMSVLVGVLSYLASYFPSGIGFLFELIALFCGGLFVLFGLRFLRIRFPKFRIPSLILQWIIFTVVAVLFVLFIIVEIQIISREKGDAQIPENAHVLVVLGCGVNGETPSLMLQHRINAAYARLCSDPDAVAVLCGGQGAGETISEAECMRRSLVSSGIEPERLILEEVSVNTKENVGNAARIIRERFPEAKEVIIVTTGFHLFRGERLMELEGFRAYGIAAKMPRNPLFWVNYHLREFASVFFMYGKEIFA